MLHSGAAISHLIRRCEGHGISQNIGNREFAWSARGLRQNTSALSVMIIILRFGFVILILSVLCFATHVAKGHGDL